MVFLPVLADGFFPGTFYVPMESREWVAATLTASHVDVDGKMENNMHFYDADNIGDVTKTIAKDLCRRLNREGNMVVCLPVTVEYLTMVSGPWMR